MIDEDEDRMRRIHATTDFYTGGDCVELRRDLCIRGRPRLNEAHQISVQYRSQIRDAPFADVPRNHCRLAIEPAIRLAVAKEHFGVRRARGKLLCPERSRSCADSSFN